MSTRTPIPNAIPHATVTLVDDGQEIVVLVAIGPERAPPCHLLDCQTCNPDFAGQDTGQDCDGHDWGNANWPTDAEIARAAGTQPVRFFDTCNGRLDCAIYRIIPRD